MKKFKNKNSKGSLLFELLIVISIIAIIFAVSSNTMFLSLKGNKMMGDRDTAVSLASETLEAVRSVADEDWMNIYNTTKASQHYYLTYSNKWTIQSGDESITLNGVTYTRYVTIDNVSRDNLDNIESTWNSTKDDPSTQKVTVTVSWLGGNPVAISDYFYRWKNKTCGQSGWTTGGSGNIVKTCNDTTYDTKDTEIDVSSGTGISLVAATSCGSYTVVGPDTLTYGTVLAEDGNCWLDRNLGATRVATAYNDDQAYGYYYQWGRGIDGHQIGTSGTTSTLSSTDTPGHGNFITVNSGNYDWRSPQNGSLWQGINGTNNPCPSGFRIPTITEIQTLATAIPNFTTATCGNSCRESAFNSILKLPTSGYRTYNSASLDVLGDIGLYWSSSPDGNNAYSLYFDTAFVFPANNDFRGSGFPVRCIKD